MPDNGYRSLHVQGALLPADSATYITYPFDVPVACTRLRLRLDYAPKWAGSQRNLVTLGIFDHNGFRGQAHRNPPDAEATVSAEAATRGFMPGPLAAGRWLAQLYVHSISSTPEPCVYTLDIEAFTSPLPGRAEHVVAQTATGEARRTPGWFRGELHSHTIHSDGSCSVAELASRAARGLDFIAITDHNTISSWADIADLPADSPLVIPALELTTFYGHAVVLGADRWIDWRTGYDGWTINDAARATHDAGGLFIIAHPSSPRSPICTGCRWDYEDMDVSLADGMEVWTREWGNASSDNPRNLRLWREQLETAHSLTGVAVSDFHSPEHWQPATPVTCVYAEELSVAAIMQGIKQGRVMLTAGPWLEVAQTAKHTVLLEEAMASSQMHSNLLASWKDAPQGARLRWLAGARQIGEMAIGAYGRAGLLAPPGRVHIELWSSDGLLLALTNPVSVA